MPAIDVALSVASILPRVVDPWPDAIGLEFPFAAAGVGGVLASAFHGGDSTAKRDQAIHDGGLWGFWLGAAFYALSLLNQVASTQ